jgi:C1A family cysteine protease
MGHDAFTVAKHGIPDESKWLYDIAKFEAKPPDAEPRAFTLRKTVKSVPQTETSIKQVLSNKQTVAFGFTVYESFEDTWKEQGVMPVPEKGESVLGGHEVLIIGYVKSHPDYALVRNSWGTGWGLGGYFLFPWKVLLDPNTCSDFRTIVRPL